MTLLCRDSGLPSVPQDIVVPHLKKLSMKSISSPYAMQILIGLDRIEIAFACDTDHDQHGIASIQLLSDIHSQPCPLIVNRDDQY
jgi:hypothetical protein